MQSSKLIILTGNNRFFGQTRKPWVSLDVKQLQATLEQNGFSVECLPFHYAANRSGQIRDSLIFYTFSQKQNRRYYIRNVVNYLEHAGNRVIPPYELLQCHEDKGYQELYKKKVGLDSVSAYYLSSKQELDAYDIDYPVVLKTPGGSNGKGVFLARNREHLEQLLDRLNPVPKMLQADLLRRKYFRSKKTYPEYPDYSNRTDYEQYRDYIVPESNFILQQFIPGLNFDYRILIMFDKYFVVRRHIRSDDFRASGAKLFDFEFVPDPELMNYARQVHQKLKSGPYLSIDVGEVDGRFVLFEFQAIHFGINPFIKNKGYYMSERGEWVYHQRKATFESEMGLALAKYIRNGV